ncbi:unnamed protein product [Medioppia subpectinata]|uniref:Uncharacterized protein n=1 Tax=Medioppia subpectinata TaxID=1979941 RepID=A0A7R9M0L7_9ACAR|nr:unnamed protein product [Medioppia subpectinata]CAG2122738.1 unnamed protein product [Medioppia subpectinata]
MDFFFKIMANAVENRMQINGSGGGNRTTSANITSSTGTRSPGMTTTAHPLGAEGLRRSPSNRKMQ